MFRPLKNITKSKEPASGYYKILKKGEQETFIFLKGHIYIENANCLLNKLRLVINKNRPRRLFIDLDNVSSIDEFGALVLLELKHLMISRGGAFELINIKDETQAILSQFKFDDYEKCTPLKRKKSAGIIVHLGESAINGLLNFRFLIAFLGSVVIALIHVCFHPKSLRIDDTIACMEKAGVEALPIVAIISYLLGLIMAFMSSLQLQQFGANIYVASLVALAMVSELGPIMTAIVVAGRSGSAFAAELGTMKISEEIDALFIMGFDITLFLAVPRIIATVLVVPLLTLFSNLFAIAGGLTIGVLMLGLTPSSYMGQTIQTITLFEISWGFVKSAVFAALIAWIACFRGLQVKGGPAAVGNAATSAVVSSIFLIILFDSIFAVIRSYWG
ncbi:MAG: ABC transporter permease [Desulfobacterales bacterium]|nr:ABC transporter permease [Desulfobacterales bacterium]